MTGRRLSLFILLIAVICFASPVFAARKKSVSQKKSVIPVEMDYAALVGKVLPSVVRITTDRSAGSGFFVSDKGEILTNYHVIKGADKILVTTINGFTASANLRIVGEDEDMAVLVIDCPQKTPFLKISDSLPKQGEAVMAAGNPHGLEGTVSNGIISAYRRNKTLIQFTAPVSPGSSGGVLVNAKGEVVGMPTLQYREGQNLNFAISPHILRDFISSLQDKAVSVNPPDVDSIELLTSIAEQGSLSGQCFLGDAYSSGKVTINGVSIPKDDKLATYWYQRAAEQGDADAQRVTAYRYYDGKGVQRNYSTALYWFLQAAEQGKRDAQYMSGLMYYFARGVNQDYKQARYWYQKAAEQGYVYAQLNLGGMYHEGEGGNQDYRTALYWYQMAAQQGNDIALLRLGYMYEDGEGVNPDMNQAIYLYRQSAKQGNNDAKNILAKFGIYDY